jgi:hypothetical protein
MSCDACGPLRCLRRGSPRRDSRHLRVGGSCRCADGPARVRAAPERGAGTYVFAHPGLRVATGSRSELLRVRARHEPDFRRELGLLVERRVRPGVREVLPRRDDQRTCLHQRASSGRRGERRTGRGQDAHRADPHPGGVRESRAPVVHREAVRALRARARDHESRRNGVEQAVRIQRALGVDPSAAHLEARPRALGARRGCHRLRRLVPGHPQGHQDAHERRRPARAVQLPPRRQLVAARALAHPPGSPSRTACLQSPTGPGARRTRRRTPRGQPGSSSCVRPCPTP